MKHAGIYIITNTVNGKRYIGSSININRRWAEHKKPSMRDKPYAIYRAFKKYGIENFKIDVLCECKDGELEFYENHYLSTIKPEYNMSKFCGAPNRGRKLSAEWRRKIGEAGKGRVCSEENKRKMSEARKGKKRSEEDKAKMRVPKTMTEAGLRSRRENLELARKKRYVHITE